MILGDQALIGICTAYDDEHVNAFADIIVMVEVTPRAKESSVQSDM